MTTGYTITLSRIAELFNEQDDDAPIPTAYAGNETLTLLAHTYDLIRNAFPVAAVSSTDNGGIRVQWMRSSGDVRLVIPGQETEQAYIFFEDGNHYETEEVSPDNLAGRLIWLNSISQP